MSYNTRIRILLHTYCDKQPVENGAAIHMFSIAFWHRFGSRFRRENPLIPAPWGRNRKSLIPENWKGFLPIALQFGKEELIKLVRFHLEFKSGQDNDLSNNLHLLHGNDVSCIVAHFIQNAFLPAEEESKKSSQTMSPFDWTCIPNWAPTAGSSHRDCALHTWTRHNCWPGFFSGSLERAKGKGLPGKR